MGKFSLTKPKRESTKLGTKVNRESSINKNGTRNKQKRLTMLLRRISVLLDEKESWKITNRELVDNYNAQKKLNAELQKEVFEYQRKYHEAIISQNSYKAKHAEMVQNLKEALKEIKSVFPHLLGVSESICRSQVRVTTLLNSASQTIDTENHLPRAFGDGRYSNSDFSKKSEKRMKHKVGPMVKGVLIQKPTVRLERVMLHQPQDQDTTINDHTPERGDALTPIVEENEQDASLHLEHISVRRRRKNRLGVGERWRLSKQQDQLEKERQLERERERENERRSATESSDSEDQLGPVIRLHRVSSLMLGTNLLEVDRGRTSEGKGISSRSAESESRRFRTAEDPKEGCSWMHVSPAFTKKKSSEKRKPVSSDSSDSSDEECNSPNVSANKVRNSLSDSLYKNKSFTLNRKTSSSSSTGDTSRDVSDSSKVEPDSTKNIEDVVFARDSTVDSICMGAMPLNISVGPNQSLGERVSVGKSRNPSTTATPATPDSARVQKRSISFCNNCTPNPSPVVEGKRIRKAKVHLYPGEEPDNHAKSTTVLGTKVKKYKLAMSSNQVLDRPSSAGKKSHGKRSLKVSLDASDNSAPQSYRGSSSGSSQNKKKYGRSKKSSVRNSSNIPRSSVEQQLSEDPDENDRRGSRRNRGHISYKEPPVNMKMRRPK